MHALPSARCAREWRTITDACREWRTIIDAHLCCTLLAVANKCEKQEQQTKDKVKKSMEKGDMVSARIYAQDAIRIKSTGTNYLRLSSRLDAVASRVESAVKMQQVSKQMGQVTKGMDKVLASMDVTQISKVMDKFEGTRRRHAAH